MIQERRDRYSKSPDDNNHATMSMLTRNQSQTFPFPFRFGAIGRGRGKKIDVENLFERIDFGEEMVYV
jgi:hypothetical protein